MIIVNGAGSQLAQNFISENQDQTIFAISRNAEFSSKHVKSVNLSSNKELGVFLETLDCEKLTWINFQTIKFDEILIKTSVEKMNESFEINFFKNFIAAKVLIPKMIKKKYGKFIFIDSVKAMMGDVGCSAYAASKGANRPLMQSIVKEYSRFNITCNTLAVGFADTPMLNKIPLNKRSALLKDVPGKKLLDSHDLNATVNLLLKNESINGQIIDLAGGLRNSG